MKYLKCLDKQDQSKISISIATKKDRKYWQNEVMPTEEYQSKEWNWVNGNVYLSSISAKAFFQKPKFIKIKLGEVYLGLMLIANNFRARTSANKVETVTLIWYLQAANSTYLKKYYIDKKIFDLSFGEALIDSGLVDSLNNKNPKILLHADPKADFDLPKYYADLNFSNIPEGSFKKISNKRPNDGRYFFKDKDNMIRTLSTTRDNLNIKYSIPTY